MEFMRCTLAVTEQNIPEITAAARSAGLTIAAEPGQTLRFVAPAGRIRFFRHTLPKSVRSRRQLWTEEAVALIEESIISLAEQSRRGRTQKSLVKRLSSTIATQLNIHPHTASDFVEDAICGMIASGILQTHQGECGTPFRRPSKTRTFSSAVRHGYGLNFAAGGPRMTSWNYRPVFIFSMFEEFF